jgi:hypothetical protein
MCVVTGFVTGTGNPYNLNIFLQLLCLGTVTHYFFGARRRANLQCSAATLAAAVCGFVVVNAHTLIHWMQHGHNPAAIPRTYREAERYALRPLELMLPPDTERFGWLSKLGKHYSTLTVPHENHSAYLGIIGAMALAWLAVWAYRRVISTRRHPGRVSALAPQVLWVLLYGIVAGGNCALAFMGILYFRGGNRFSIFIAAIALFFLVSRMSLLARGWDRRWSYLAATVIAVVGLLDQLPAPDRGATEAVRQKLESDREFAAALESKLPRGAMVYQFPEIGFPEGHPVYHMGEYDFIRPYLFTGSLRFSYGFNDGRPREQWQHDMGELLAAERLSLLEAYGFSGAFINRKAFADNGEEVLRVWAALGRTNVIEDRAREQACILLYPSPTPRMPPFDRYALVVMKSGWIGFETMWHTSAGYATAYFVNEGEDGRYYAVSALIGSETGHSVEMSINGENAGSVVLQPGEVKTVDIGHVRAKRGHNEIIFRADKNESGGTVAFGVANLKAMIMPGP